MSCTTWCSEPKAYTHRFCIFFFNDTATTEIYTLSLHDALPISGTYGSTLHMALKGDNLAVTELASILPALGVVLPARSEEHTSELQSRQYLVCRLLLEKKKNSDDDLCEHVAGVVALDYAHAADI